jgi:hypothetical protein
MISNEHESLPGSTSSIGSTDGEVWRGVDSPPNHCAVRRSSRPCPRRSPAGRWIAPIFVRGRWNELHREDMRNYSGGGPYCKKTRPGDRLPISSLGGLQIEHLDGLEGDVSSARFGTNQDHCSLIRRHNFKKPLGLSARLRLHGEP